MEWILLGAVALAAIWAITVYNGLVTLRARTGQAYADIDVQLKQRHDLMPALIETVKGYADHERETLDAVMAARASALGAQGSAQLAAAEQGLSGALGRLFALAEAYPDLKANANFQQLQVQLSEIEDKLAAARRFFNNAVAEYNAATEAFPAMLVAGRLGFTQREFFDVGPQARATLDAPPALKF
jgi:LemA protein